MDNQTYFNGDFWQCAADTNPGDSPTTAPAKWRRIQIPKEWRRVLAKLAFANLLELDGQTDKAKIHRDTGEALLEDFVREAARQENDRRSGSVRLPQGQTIAASVILDDAYGLMRWDPADLEDSQKADGRRSLSAALQQVWEAWWWDSLMVGPALMALRDAYDPDNFYLAGQETYFPATRQYYLAVQPVIGISPAMLVNGSYALNSQFWALSADHYCGADVDNSQPYAFGTQLRNPGDGLFYQRSGSIQASGAGTADANGIYVSSATEHDGKPLFLIGDQAATIPQIFDDGHTFARALPAWAIAAWNSGTLTAEYFQTDAATPTTPDQVQGWSVPIGDPGTPPGPTFSTLFVAAACPDPGSWGLLTPFDHVLAIHRPVRSVSRENPAGRHGASCGAYHLEPAPGGGMRVPDWSCGTAWVWSRRITPVVTGNDFDPAATYAATAATELVYDS